MCVIENAGCLFWFVAVLRGQRKNKMIFGCLESFGYGDIIEWKSLTSGDFPPDQGTGPEQQGAICDREWRSRVLILVEPRRQGVNCGAGLSDACAQCLDRKGTLLCRGSTRVYSDTSFAQINTKIEIAVIGQQTRPHQFCGHRFSFFYEFGEGIYFCSIVVGSAEGGGA